MSEVEVISPEQVEEDEKLRNSLQESLSNGLDVEVEPRAYTHEEILEVISRLQNLEESDVINKLKVAGFTLKPYVIDDDEQACETCMYYKVHRRFCELPELMLPVEEEWSCRLWRI
ncbi:MAG: hypothetical protein RIB78_06315 [Gammaproteobacteria bacterium]